MESILEFSNISKSFGNTKVLNRLSLEIKKGEILGLIGPSGSGKSTLINIMLGLLRYDSGHLIYDGKKTDGKSIRNKTGITTQENSFYGKLTVFENMRYYCNLYDVKSPMLEKHIMWILSSVRLEDARDARAERISGGMKRRLDFALSIIHDPELLILDEPTTGLDPLLVGQFWDIIKDFNKRGKTMLVISHIFPELKENCDRVAFLNKGKIVKTIKIKKKTDLVKEFSEVVG